MLGAIAGDIFGAPYEFDAYPHEDVDLPPVESSGQGLARPSTPPVEHLRQVPAARAETLADGDLVRVDPEEIAREDDGVWLVLLRELVDLNFESKSFRCNNSKSNK